MTADYGKTTLYIGFSAFTGFGLSATKEGGLDEYKNMSVSVPSQALASLLHTRRRTNAE